MADDRAFRRSLVEAYMAMNNGQIPPDMSPEEVMGLMAPDSTATQSPKALLDAYRAMNGGALPPGMTPEQAQLIDMGMDSAALAANPQLGMILQQISQARIQQGQDFSASRDWVGQNYQNLTGDVANQGTAWMADLATRMGLTPEQIAADPNMGEYGATIANMKETADQNQATDQAWFTKMMQANDANLANLAMGFQTGAIPLPGADLSGGGGGGGRGGGYGGRGYRRRGRGGDDGDGIWTDPKTTDTVNQAADEFGNFYNPGFVDAVLGAFTDPFQYEVANQVLDEYGEAPRDVGAGIVKNRLAPLQATLDAQVAQQAQRRLYMDRLPVETANAQERGLAQEQAIRATNSLDEDDRIRDFLPVDSPERKNLNTDVGIMLLQGLKNIPRGSKASGGPDRGTGSWLNQIEDRAGTSWSEILDRQAMVLRQERDREQYEEALQGATSTDPFSFEGWKGYVPGINPKEAWDNARTMEALNIIRAISNDWDPNRDWQVTRLSQQDSSDTKTTQSSKDPSVQIFDNNDPNGGGQATAPFTPFGTSKGLPRGLTESAQRLIQNRINAMKPPAPVETTEPRESSWDAFRKPPVGRTEPKSKKTPPYSKPAPTKSVVPPQEQNLRNVRSRPKSYITWDAKKDQKNSQITSRGAAKPKPKKSSWSAFRR